jgi:hypothetical protein
VVEGYGDLKCTEPQAVPLLSNVEYVEAFQRFRNANFHYQEDPFSPKLVEFLHADGSEDWSRALYAALQSFFIRHLPIQQHLDDMAKAKLQ